jgi:NitT/TauT family transport system substrate-binding protein
MTIDGMETRRPMFSHCYRLLVLSAVDRCLRRFVETVVTCRKRMPGWRLMRVLSGLSAALMLTACLQDPAPPLSVGTIVWPGYEPLFLARALGYYDEQPIQFIEYPSATEVIRGFESGAIDAATLTTDEVLRLAVNEQEPRIVLAMDSSFGADAILASNEFGELKDLRGHRIGAEPNALGAYMLMRGLETAGLTKTDVHVVPLRIFETEEALSKGEVDAVVTFEPYRTRLLAAGAHTLFDSRRIPGEIHDVLCVRKRLLARSNPPLQSLVDGWFRALDYLHHDPSDAANRMATRQELSPEQFLSALQGIRIQSRAESEALLHATDPALGDSLRNLADVMLEHGLLRGPVETGPLLDPILVDRAHR